MASKKKKSLRSPAAAPPPKAPKAKSDTRLFGAIALLTIGLGGLVWWSLPGNHSEPPPEKIGLDDEDGSVDELFKELGDAAASLTRPPQASATFAIVTAKPNDVVRSASAVTEIQKRLAPRHCGNACDAVRKFLDSEDAFEVEVVTTDDLILPPKDTLETVAPGLTAPEREDLQHRPISAVVRTHGAFTKDQLPARAAFAAAAVLAEALDGFVYDEVSRRIETTSDFLTHTITSPLGEPPFERRHIVVQLYRSGEGTARLVTLGMARFGSPDLAVRGANMGAGPQLAEVVNTVASKLAFDLAEPSVTVTLDDVARVVGKKPAELNPDPARAKPVMLTLVDGERAEGDPDNDLTELVPWGGATRENWDAVITSLFGTPASMTTAADDPELARAAKKARETLPAAIKRFEHGEGELFVKGPFAIPEEARVDGGAPTELLWLQASSCDARACTGALSNEPSYVTNLAAGRTTSIPVGEIADWMLRQRDGGTAGGESIQILKSRLP